MRFKDVFSIIGSSMIGPSSSHTAGAVRLGRTARRILGCLPEQADIVIYGSSIGYVIANNSFISGAEGGCQAEVGSAIGMAAGALTELRGGTPEQSVHAAGLALKNSLGLICDPVGGLVEIPCIVRNGFGAVTAQAASDMALAGVRSVIPSDEVIQVMLDVGTAMPEKHRETAKGGLAQTPTGRKIMKELYGIKDQPARNRGNGK